ncbi:MAG: immunoglobulin domain-containing protein [Bacteroidales bacterium]|nr:immunoglobulin domain-containing protein [Bacteroidales bacterium]
MWISDVYPQAAYITGWRHADYNYCSAEGPDTITGGSPSGKPFYIDGVSYTSSPALVRLVNGVAVFYPDRVGVGTHSIVYGTIGSHDVTVLVTVQPMPAVTLAPFSNVCANAPPYSLFNSDSSNVSPKTGYFTGPGVDASGIFNPSAAGPGTHNITYTAGVGSCESSVSRTITVLAVPVVGISPFPPVCEGSNAFQLTQGFPVGGTYSGTGVDGSGYFNASVTGLGSFSITYSYSNGTCSSNASRDIVVSPRPSASFSGLGSQYCTDDAGIPLTGDPAGASGVFSGSGITDNGNGTAVFDPFSSGLGLHQVSYIFTSPEGCSDTVLQNVQVGTNVTLGGLAAKYCVNSSDVLISGNPAGGTFAPAPGLTDHGNSTATFSPSAAGAGNFNISYTYIDANGCINTKTEPVRVYALPVPAILNLAPAYCANSPQINITGNYAPSGIFSGASTTDNGNGTAIFEPANLLPGGPYNINYSYQDVVSGCQTSTTSQVLINPVPEAVLSGDASVCYGSPASMSIALTGTSPYQITYTDGSGTYTEGGIAGPVFNTQVYPVDTTTYTMVQVTDSKNCSSSGTGSITISVLPEVRIITQPVSQTVCAGSNIQFRVEAEGVNLQYQWEKDGIALAGANQDILALNNVQASDLGSYHCVVSGDCGADITSNDAQLLFWSPVVLNTNPSDAHECEGEDISFIVQASGSNLTYQWYRNNQELQDTGNYAGTSGSILFIDNLKKANEGNYHAVVSGSCGTITSSTSMLEVDRNIVITSQPSDVALCEGNNANLTVFAEGDNLQYQWQKDHVNIPGATGTTLSIINASEADEGFYLCIITSTCGNSIFSNQVQLSVNNYPAIISNPVSLLRCEGDNANFAVNATGSGISYQWQKNGVNLIEEARISGTQSNSLSINQVNGSDIGSYACIITGSCNTIATNPATLSVDTSLAIVTHPANVEACLNSNVFFTVTATGNNLSFQWLKDGTNLPGETGSTLVINNIQSTHAGNYTCLIGNSCGRTVTSDPAKLSINESVSIVMQPSDTRLCEGQNAIFTTQASGAGLVYQWELNGVIITDHGNISGTSSNVLIIQQINELNEGVYNCLVTGYCGNERSIPASLIVDDKLNLTEQPLGDTVCEGGNVQFRVVAEGVAKYQWQEDETDLPGENSAVLLLNNITASDSGVYRCLLFGACDTMASDGALLTVNVYPQVILQPVPVSACENRHIQFSSDANGTGLTWQWMKNGTVIHDGNRIIGSTSPVLIIDSVKIADAAVYTAQITGYCGNTATNPVTLSVEPAAVIIMQPQPVTTCENQSAGFTVLVSGAATYQWQKDNLDLPGQTTATLSLSNISTADAGAYRCRITSGCSDFYSEAALLTVNPVTVIIQQPADLTLCSGNAALIPVTASGTGLTYEWKRNGITVADDGTIAGSQTASLSINLANTNHSGIYHCIITGVCGSVTSNPANIEVLDQITVTSQPASENVCQGESASFEVMATGQISSWQWQKNGVDIAGATSANYSINAVTIADTGLYRCRLTGSCGQVFSEAAALRVDLMPVISSQPDATIEICEGNQMVLHTAAKGTNLAYQWYLNNTPLADDINITGTASPWLTVNHITQADEGIYLCRVDNLCTAAIITGTQVWVNSPVTITDQPDNTSACTGDDISLAVAATGDGISYQWQKGNADLAGATSPVLALNNVLLTDSGTYRCVIISACDTIATNAVRVSISEPAAISMQPAGLVTPCTGSMIRLDIAATGNVTGYQWKKNGISLVNDSHVSGAQTSSLIITTIDTGDEGLYTCDVIGTCNTVASLVTRVDVQTPPVINFHPADYSVLSGGNADFTVNASGDSLRYQWYFNGSPLTNGVGVSGTNSSHLNVLNVSISNQGAYNALVTGYCGSSASNAASLTILSSSIIVVQPNGNTRCEGESVTISITATSGIHTYQWKRNGVILSDNIRTSGSQGSSLTITDLVAADAGAYSCLVDGIENSIPAILYVNRTTTVTSVSGETDLCNGEAITLQVSATGDSLKYSWYRDGIKLSDDLTVQGSSTGTLGIHPVDPGYSGSYYCEVSGACGMANSTPMDISVSSPAFITTQPANVTVCEGMPINISVGATGSNLTYQWQKNGTAITDDARITGAQNAALVINNAATADAGVYSCIISGTCNTVYSTSALTEVLPVTTITQQPVNANRCRNDEVTFVVSVNNILVTYQWQKDGVNLLDDISVSGSQTSVLQIRNLEAADNGNYQCIITGPCNTLISNPATLSVFDEPVIIVQPSGNAICEGSSFTFSLTATGSSLSWQWLKDGVALSDNARYSGTSSATLIISNVTLAENGTYQCLVSGSCQSTMSLPAILEVEEATRIIEQPQSKYICIGTDFSLTALAAGDGNSWQWMKDNMPLTDGGDISGATSSVLHISNATPLFSGVYHCVVTGSCNSISSTSATITVTVPPSIIQQPADATICQGGNNLMQLTASGDDLAFAWKKNGVVISNGGDISGATTPALYLENIIPAFAGIYTCEVANVCGITNSNPANLVVNQTGQITEHPVDLQECLGEQASFRVATTGNNLNYQWEFNGSALSDNARITGSQMPYLTLTGIMNSDQGLYRCVVTDGCGVIHNSDAAGLTVYQPLTLTAVSAGDTLCTGQSITLSVSATGSNLNYQWFRDGISITDGGGIAGTATSSLVINNIIPEFSGYYSCVITGSCDHVVTNAIPVLVSSPVQVSEQPQNLVRCEGESVLFSVAATGDSITYHWEKDGISMTDDARINGAASSLLLINNITAADAGSYRCVISGVCGIVNSQPAVLQVNVFPEAAGSITGESIVCQGTSGITYMIADIPNADYYQWTLPPGLTVISGQNTRQIQVEFVENEYGGPISVSGVNGCGSGPASPILNVVANPLPLTYGGENIGICSDEGLLNAVPPELPATGIWQAISGPAVIQHPDQAVTTVSNLRQGANPFTWTVTLNGCIVTDTVTLYNNQLVVEAGNDTSICDHIQQLNAVAPSAGTGQWSITLGSGYNINRYDPNTLVSGLSQGRNIFRWSVNYNGCISYDSVIITNNRPTESEAGPDQSIHADNTNLNANNPTIGTGAWSLLSGSATIADRFAYNTLLTGIGKGRNIFEWMITHAGCVSADTVVIENVLTDTTDAGPNQVICSSSVRLAAKDPYPGYGEWSVKRGSANFANNSLYNTYAYNLAQGENVLVWTAYLNGTTSDSVIIINDMPTTANAGVNLSICADSVNLNANLPYIGSGQWSVISGAGMFDDATKNVTRVSNLARGNNNLKWTITNGTCTSSSVVTITNNTPTDAEAGFDAVICEDSLVLQPNTPTFGTGEWSVYSGAAKFSGNLAYDLGRDENYLVYSIRNAGCYSRDTVVITSHKPTTARSGADQSVCHDSVLLIANQPATGNGSWTLQSGSATLDDPSSSSTYARNLAPGENVFRWTITYMECVSHDDVMISNDYVQAEAGADQVMCSDRTLLQANDPGYSEGFWTIAGAANGADILDPHTPNSVVENLAPGANVLRWTITKNSCISYDEVVLTNNLPTRAFAGEDMYLCQDEQQLRANTISQGTGTWSVLSGSGSFSDLNNSLAMVSDLGSGANILRWTSENQGCTTTDEVVIYNNLPVDVYAGLDQELCSDSTVLYANPPSLGKGYWTVLQGSAVFDDPLQYNTSVNQLRNGINKLKWTVATTGCSVTDTVQISNNLPSVAVAGSDFAVCNSTGTLSANTPMYGTGEWSLMSGSGNIASPALPQTTITELALGENILVWTISNKNCSSSDELKITNNSPTIAEAGEDAEVCGETAVLYANSPVVGYGYWQVMSGKGDFTDSLNFNTTINGLNFGENTLRWTTQNGQCLTIDEITVTNNLAYVYAGEDKDTYEPQVMLSGNNPPSGTGEWILVAGAGTIETPSGFTTQVASLGAGLNTFEWTITNGSCVARDQVIINYKVMPKAGFTTDVTEGCPGTTVEFFNTTQYGTTYRWDMGDGSFTTDVNPVHTYNYAGQYKVNMIAYGPDNKIVTADALITIHSNPVARFYFRPDTAFVNKPVRCYDDDSHNVSAYYWDFGDNQYASESNPMHYYSASGNYRITLIVASDFGCTDTISHEIFVAEDGLLIFPNAFTPDPSGPGGGIYDENDRTNNVFFPYHQNVAEYHLEIYSRWGVLLFESNDVKTGWDGYYKGQLLAQDVYVWKVTGKYVSGSDFIRTGTVLLVR